MGCVLCGHCFCMQRAVDLSVQSTSGACSRPLGSLVVQCSRAVDLWGRLSCSRPLACSWRAVDLWRAVGVQSTQSTVDLDLDLDLWGRFVEARVTNASENGMIKSTILKDIGRLSFLEPQARVTATLLEPEARVKQQRRNE